MDVQKVGRAIAGLRKQAGYTQKDLADRIGISDKAVSKWERGLSLPDITYLRKLSILLGTDTDSLLAGTPAIYTGKWRGLIVLKENSCGISSTTYIYDKPLVYFLLSYFLLVGIKDITFVCSEKERKEILRLLGTGAEYGIILHYYTGNIRDINVDDSEGNIMMVNGRCLLYGVDQTRFFQKAMSDREQLTVLALPKKNNPNERHISINSKKKIIYSNTNERSRSEYDYCTLPILFFPTNFLSKFTYENNPHEFLSSYAQKEELFVELLDRGFVEFSIDTWDSVQEASTFIRIVQDRCGMNVYCLEEVAWRRGFITLKQLYGLSDKYIGTKYGLYLKELHESYKDTEYS